MDNTENTNGTELSELTPFQDEYNALRKQKGSAPTAEEFEAQVGPVALKKMLLQNGFRYQPIMDKLESGYNAAAENEMKSYNANLGLSQRDENGSLVGEKSVYNMPSLNRGVSMRDRNTIRKYTSEGDDANTMDALRSLTGMDFEGYTSPSNARIAIANRANEIINEMSTTQDDAKKAELNSEFDNLTKQAQVLEEFMGIVGSKWDNANNKYSDVSAVTADELMTPRAKAMSENELEYNKQKNALRNKKIGRGIGDLVRSLGNGIQSITGSKVGDYNFNQPYQQLDAQGQQLYQRYLAQQEQLRREQVQMDLYKKKMSDEREMKFLENEWAKQKAAQAHLDKMDELEEKNEAAYERALVNAGVASDKARAIAKREAARGSKHEGVIGINGVAYGFNKNEGSKSLANTLLSYMENTLKLTMIKRRTGSDPLSPIDPIATINYYLGDHNDPIINQKIKDWLDSYLGIGVDKLNYETTTKETQDKTSQALSTDNKSGSEKSNAEDKKEESPSVTSYHIKKS